MLGFTIFGTDKEIWINPLNIIAVQVANTSNKERTLLICGDNDESMYYVEGNARDNAIRVDTVLHRWGRR